MMRSTVIGVYDERSQAQAAVEELVRTGFGRQDIQLLSAEEAQAADQSQRAAGNSNSDIGAGSSGSGKDVNLVFKSLFGGMEYGGSTSDQDYHGDIYSEAVRRGGCVLAVQSRNDEQHAEIINIMDRFNPIDIDDRVANWRAQGWTGRSTSTGVTSGQTTAYASTTGDASPNEASLLADRQTAVHQPSTMGSTPDSAAISGHTLSSSGMSSERRSGVRVFPYGSQSGAGDLNLTDNQSLSDDDYRSHWQTNYAGSGGRYEDHAPAYQYGSRLAGDERYSSTQWNDIEPQVRTDWESNNAGHPWEKAKDAVRYGWEKMTTGRGRQ
jgi:hypothetical protein